MSSRFEASSRSGRIAGNTLLLYGRMLILMVINLYTVRVVLLALGVEDYGIYTSVAGVITMLNVINSVMSNATQRFYSLYMGRKDLIGLTKVFSVSLDFYIVFIIAIFILGETIGLWFVNEKLVIPENRIVAGNWAYQFSILTFAATMISVPFYSLIIAHEKIGIYSIFTTLEYVIKLIFAVLLTKLRGDVLILYAFLNFIAQVFLTLSYFFYNKKHFDEAHYLPFKKSGMHKDVVFYSGWTLFGSVAGVGMHQVMTILYNIFFGPIVTAARAISLQISSALTAFSNSFITALRPPMIKSYSESNNEYLMKLFSLSNKFIFYSLVMITVPMLLEMDTILKVWLDVTDIQTINFSKLIIFNFIILVLGNPITIIIQAIGKVKDFYLRVEAFTILCPILTYVLFKLGFNPYYGYFSMIFMMFLSHIMRLICLKKLYPFFKYKDYILGFVFPGLLISSIVMGLCYIVHSYFNQAFIRFVSVLFTSVIATAGLIYLFGLSKEEKIKLKEFINSFRKKL